MSELVCDGKFEVDKFADEAEFNRAVESVMEYPCAERTERAVATAGSMVMWSQKSKNS
jgi:hypothetical protein